MDYEYSKTAWPIRIVAFILALYLSLISGVILISNLLRDLSLVSIARLYDTGSTYILIEKFGGEEANKQAEKNLKKHGYLFEFGRGLLGYSAIIIFVHFLFSQINWGVFLWGYTFREVYFVFLYTVVLSSTIAGLINSYLIISKSILKLGVK